MARKGVKDVKVFVEYDLVNAMDIMALRLRQESHSGKIGVGNIAESMIVWASVHNAEFKEAVALVRQWVESKMDADLSSIMQRSQGEESGSGEEDASAPMEHH